MMTASSRCAPSVANSQPGAFVPAWWCRGANAQTIWAALLPGAPRLPVVRERWDTPDGDFLDMDRLAGAPDQPIIVILHGLEGGAGSPHVLGLLRAAHQRQWAALAVNFRSCSGEINRLRRSYHGGDTGDLAWIVDRLATEDSSRPIAGIGMSLGANVLLKYLGERGDAVPRPLGAAVAISTPFDLAVCARAFEHGFWPRVYMKRIVKSLTLKTLEKLRRFPDLVDRERLSRVRTIAEFDELVTAPVHGFPSADAYWRASSCAQFLPGIRRPTLLISAQDDPVVPSSVLPIDAIAKNTILQSRFPASGGHVGFIDGPWPWRPERWAEHQALAFLAERMSG